MIFPEGLITRFDGHKEIFLSRLWPGTVVEIQTEDVTYWVTVTDWVRPMGAGIFAGLSVTTNGRKAGVIDALGISPYQLMVYDQVLQSRTWEAGGLTTSPVTDISVRYVER